MATHQGESGYAPLLPWVASRAPCAGAYSIYSQRLRQLHSLHPLCFLSYVSATTCEGPCNQEGSPIDRLHHEADIRRQT